MGDQVATSPETHVVILLDLAVQNPIGPDAVLGCLPVGVTPTRVLKLTDFGITQCATGTPQEWPPVIAAIDRLVDEARTVEQSGARCRYWVAGRAGLPAFFHLGYRLTKKAITTLVNPRDAGPLDVLSLDLPGLLPGDASTGAAPYFERSRWPDRASVAPTRLSLLVSSRIRVSAEQVERLMSSRKGRHGDLIQAHAATSLDATTIALALHELEDMMAGIRTWYPGCGELAVFIAGPATLAFLLGRSINPHIFQDVHVFQHRNNQYQLAYECRPAGPQVASKKRGPAKKHKILYLASNPVGTRKLALDREARDIHEELERSKLRHRFEFMSRWAPQPLGLLHAMRKLKPQIVHFSGHGQTPGIYLEGPDGSLRPVPNDAIVETFHVVGASVQAVVLSTCYSESLAKALCAHIDCVIGMSSTIEDEAAKIFAIGFYGGLGDGDSVRAAFGQGRAAMLLERARGADQLRLKTRPGVDASQLFLK
ncbi:MAG TPA: SAVED domain-containing protein [Kofleriaceae bacterium]|nr:SAVED domain-containing protein [Kofleriaceae bacterium]